MIITINESQLVKAITLVLECSGEEKRLLSPNPEKEPYWHHLIRVYQSLSDNGYKNLNILTAAILHDSIEDGHLTSEEIIRLFNPTVEEIVRLLTETTSRDRYLKKIRDYPKEDIRKAAMAIKVADRYDNLIGISFTNLEDKKIQYIEETNKYIKDFAKEVGMSEFLNKALKILKGNEKPVDLDITLNLDQQ